MEALQPVEVRSAVARKCVSGTVGLVWQMLTVAFEVLFGRFVVDLTCEPLAADYILLIGRLMPLGLLSLFFGPMIASRLRGEGSEIVLYLAKQKTCSHRTSTQQPHHPTLLQRLPAPLVSDRDTMLPGV